MRDRLARLIAWTCVWSSLLHAQQNWPQFLGPERRGYSDETIDESKWPSGHLPSVIWSAPAGNSIASPVVEGGKLYTMGSLRLDADIRDGVSEEEMYTRSELRKDRSALADSLGVFPEDFPYKPASAYAFCFDASTGEQLWATKIADLEFLYCSEGMNISRAAPLVHEGKAYFQTHTGVIACLETQTGDIVWRKSINDLGSEAQYHFGKRGVGGAPFSFDGRVYFTYPYRANTPGGIQMAYSTVAAFEPNTGDTLWTRELQTGFRVDVLSASVAQIEGKSTIVIPGGFATYGIDPVDGAILWEFDARAQWPEIDPQVNREDSTNCVLWRAQYPGKIPVIWKDYVVNRVYTWVGSEEDRTYCIKITNGKPSLVWDKKTVRYYRGTNVAKDSLLFAMDAGHARPPCPEPTCRMYPCHSEKRFQCINIPTGETYWTTDEFTESSDPDNHSYGYFEPECLVAGDYVIVIHMNKIAYGKFDLSGVSLRSSVAKDLWGVSPMAVSNGLLYFQKMDATTEIDSGAANLFCFDIGGDSVGVNRAGHSGTTDLTNATSTDQNKMILYNLAGKQIGVLSEKSMNRVQMPRGVYVMETGKGAATRCIRVPSLDGRVIHSR